MKKFYKFLSLIIFLNSVLFLKAQTWNYLGSAQFAQGYEPDIEIYNGEVYVAFRDVSNNSKCTVMKFDGSNWLTVGNAGFTPDKISEASSMAISSIGEIYVAFKDYDIFNRASLMKFDGSNWNYVGSAGFSNKTADYIDLTLKQDIPIVAYQKNNEGVVVQKFNGSGYDFLGSQSNIGSGDANYIDIEVDNNNELLVAYRNILAVTQFATVRRWDGNAWGNEANPNFSTGDMIFTTLTVDKATNTPYVAFSDKSSGNNGNLVVMKSDGSAWQNVGNPMDTVLGSVDNMEIRFFNGQPYLAFLEYQGGFTASAITYNGTKWEYIGSRGFSPINSDNLKMAIDENNGKMYVVFNESGYVSVMTFDLGMPSSIYENQEIAHVNVYPNPSIGKYIVTSKDHIEKITVYNQLSEVVLSEIVKNKSTTIDLSGLVNGIYFAKIKNQETTETMILIKQ